MRKLLLLLAVCSVVLFGVVSFYFYEMYSFGHKSISNNNQDWGNFGSFVGGILSPIFSLLSVIFVFHATLATRADQQKNMDAIEQNNRLNYLIKIIELCNSSLDKRPLPEGIVPIKQIQVYEGHSEMVLLDQTSVRSLLLQQHSAKTRGKFISKQYLDYVFSLTHTAHSLYSRLIEFSMNLKDLEELNRNVDLLDAAIDMHSIDALLNLEIMYYRHSKKVFCLKVWRN